MADEVVVKYKADINGYKAELKEAQAEAKKTEESGTVAAQRITDEFKKTEASAASISAQLKKLQKDLHAATDPKEVERLSKEVGKLKDQIGSANASANVFASGSKFVQLGNAIGGVGNNLRSLDFGSAAAQAKLLGSVIGSISFKDIVAGVKDFGGTIVSIGKSLLGNPLFLLAGALTAIGFAAKEAITAFQQIGVQTKTVTEAIDAQSKAIKSYSDRVAESYINISQSLGLLSKVQADQKREEIKNSQERLAVQQKYSEDIVKLATETGVDLSKANKKGYFDLAKSASDFSLTERSNQQRFNLERLKLETAYHEQFNKLTRTQLAARQDQQIKANIESIDKSRAAIDAIREKQKADAEKQLQDSIAEQERLDKVLRDLRTANISLEYERKKQIIINNFDDEAKRYTGHNEILIELEKKKNKELEDLDRERDQKNADILKAAQNNNVQIFKDGLKGMEAADVGFSEKVKKNQEDITKIIEQEVRKREQMQRDSLQTIGKLLGDIGSISSNVSEGRINDIERSTQKEVDLTNYLFEHKEITQEQHDAKIEAIEKQKQEKIRAERKRQFELERQIAIGKIIIATALAVITQFAETGYYGAILAGVVGAAELAVVASEPTPQFGKGGKVKGKLHTQGGTMVEAEKDEWIIRRDQSIKNDRLLRAINEGNEKKFIYEYYIAPVLKEQQKKFNEQRDKSFASNIASSLAFNFRDSNILDSLKASRKQEKEIAKFIVKNLKPQERDARRF